MKKPSKGFTLIELLVVVSIIGILATMIIPRFLNSNRRAEIAEAINFLGTLRRAQLTYADTDGNGAFLGVRPEGPGGPAEGWAHLGIMDPEGGRFDYICEAGECHAKWETGDIDKGSPAVTINITTGQLTCGNDRDDTPFTNVTDAQGNVLGCR